MLVLLSGIGSAELLAVAGHYRIALRELRQRLTSQLGLENGQLKGALQVPLINDHYLTMGVVRRLLTVSRL